MKYCVRCFLSLIIVCSFFHMAPLVADDCGFDFDDFVIPPPDPEVLIVATLGSIIKKPLWDQTYIPNGRDALYLIPNKITNLQAGGVYINLFFNSTDRMKVTIGEVFNTESINLALAGIVKILSSTNNNAQEIARVTPLLKKMSIQERKAGALMQFGVVRGPLVFQLHTSLLIAERNFWLSTRNQEKIRQIIAQTFPDFESLDDGELMKVRAGFGDTRLKMGLNLVNLHSVQADIGIEAIIPTGDITSSHAIKNEIASDPSGLLPVVLDRTQKLILEPRLGNRGHLGFGIFFEGKISLWEDRVNLWNCLSFDHFFKADEDRLFLLKKTLSPDDLDCTNLTRFLREYIVPSVFRVSALPGSIANVVFGADTRVGECRIGLGYDYYLQKKERFLEVFDGLRDDLMLEEAVTPLAEQHKIFLEGVWTKNYKKSDLSIGIGCDLTLVSTNIGKDWTSYFKVGILF